MVKVVVIVLQFVGVSLDYIQIRGVRLISGSIGASYMGFSFASYARIGGLKHG